MFTMKPSFRRWTAGAILLVAALAHGAARAQAPERIDFPPGVTLERNPKDPKIPMGYAAQRLRVDWTNPFLKTRLVDAMADRPGRAPALTRLEGNERTPTLRLQVSEPVQDEGGAAPTGEAGAAPGDEQGGWSLALPIDIGEAAPLPAGESGLMLGALGGWLPAGAALADHPEWPVSPELRGDWVGVRWLGRAPDLEKMPSLAFEDFCLISLTRPGSGETRFVLVQRDVPGEGRLEDLRDWLRDLAADGDWMAVHSIGRQAWAGMQGWRLTHPGDPRRIQRAGGVLEFRGLAAGERVDWLRLSGVKLRASSYERDFPPALVASGRTWPLPLQPNVWMNRLGAERGEAPWIEAEFTQSRPVERIVVAWAGAAGWSPRFHPRRCLLQVETDRDSQPRTVLEIEAPEGTVTEWRPERPVHAHRIRLVFPEPSRDAQDGRARVAALQAWGPWDGESGPN
jgi:hypothetical protein